MLDVVPKRQSIYQPEQEGLIFPQLPVFRSYDEERYYRQTPLDAACRAGGGLRAG